MNRRVDAHRGGGLARPAHLSEGSSWVWRPAQPEVLKSFPAFARRSGP
jgi:hypothetical protein